MRVDAINQVSQVYQPKRVGKVGKAEKSTNTTFEKLSPKKKDEFDISGTAQDMNIAKEAMEKTSDVREDKVAYFKEALASGSYNVSSQEIAEKLVNKYFDALA